MPSGGFKRTHDFGKHESVQRIEVHQQRVANVAAKNVESQLAIERHAIQEMSD